MLNLLHFIGIVMLSGLETEILYNDQSCKSTSENCFLNTACLCQMVTVKCVLTVCLFSFSIQSDGDIFANAH